jgi:tRNA A-37 threonylcarbamoyl transferase component Bud32
MRDARWVNRFLYTWNNAPFYDPLAIAYRPKTDGFLSNFDDETRKGFVRGGLWWSYRHNPRLPSQGWKIHVSANQRDANQVADLTIRYLVDQKIDFKVALDLNIFEMLNSKAMTRGKSGKLVTIYPRDEEEFRTCLDDLAKLLDGMWGAYVLSDHRYKDSKALYFRYGQFLDTHSIDIMGKRVAYIVDPEGNRISDSRPPVFSKPSWVSWPFPDWDPGQPDDAVELLGNRFRVLEALTFSNTGGVYKAQDVTDNDRIVILKEARPGTNVNPREDYDAVDVLKREWDFLNRLSDVGLFPRPIELFQEWEHHFLAEEFISGTGIRSILFKHNPLVRLPFDKSDSQSFLRIFLKVFKGFATAVAAAHERKIIIGDLSATNLLIEPDTFEVRLIDLEAARLVDSSEADQHLQRAVDLYTPGFSRSRDVGRRRTEEDDLYGVATIMAYFIFPIAAMSYLRHDVFTLYRYYIDVLGWPGDIYDVLTGLVDGTTTLEEAIIFVSDVDPLLERVEVGNREPTSDAQLDLPAVERRLANFVIESADPQRETLFPVDPFAHLTNPLSLGFGASGVLYTLNAIGVDIRPEWMQWFDDKLAALDVREYSAGFMSGLAGIAWAADALGLEAKANDLLAEANSSIGDSSDYTYYYGLSGLGMCNLQFYTRRKSTEYLQAAESCAKELCAQAQQDGEYVCWTNDFAVDGPMTGLGFGQAGVAMFLLRMYQATKDETYLGVGEKALGWEMAHAVEGDDGSLMFRHEGTLLPYVEVGGAGVAQVLLRYQHLRAAEKVLKGLRRTYSVMPGYLFGMSGIIDALLDGAAILGDSSYRIAALQQFDYVKKIFLFEPSDESPVRFAEGLKSALAVPGEGLLRCACDLATGSAGVLQVVHRLHSGRPSDFLLDQLGT